MNTQPHHTQRTEHGWHKPINYSTSGELLWVEPVPCRSCNKQLTSDVRDGDKRLPGQAVAEAADRVSNRAGLVNLDIIDTPLTAFFPPLSSSI